MIRTKNKLALPLVAGLQDVSDDDAQSIVGGSFDFGITRGNEILGSISVFGASGIREATQNDSQLRLTNQGGGSRFVVTLAEQGGGNIATLRTTANVANSGEIIEVGNFINIHAPGRTDIEWRVTQLPTLAFTGFETPPDSPTSIIDICSEACFPGILL